MLVLSLLLRLLACSHSVAIAVVGQELLVKLDCTRATVCRCNSIRRGKDRTASAQDGTAQ